MVFLEEFFEKVDFEKNQQTTKKHEKFPGGQRVNPPPLFNPCRLEGFSQGMIKAKKSDSLNDLAD